MRPREKNLQATGFLFGNFIFLILSPLYRGEVFFLFCLWIIGNKMPTFVAVWWKSVYVNELSQLPPESFVLSHFHVDRQKRKLLFWSLVNNLFKLVSRVHVHRWCVFICYNINLGRAALEKKHKVCLKPAHLWDFHEVLGTDKSCAVGWRVGLGKNIAKMPFRS